MDNGIRLCLLDGNTGRVEKTDLMVYGQAYDEKAAGAVVGRGRKPGELPQSLEALSRAATHDESTAWLKIHQA